MVSPSSSPRRMLSTKKAYLSTCLPVVSEPYLWDFRELLGVIEGVGRS